MNENPKPGLTPFEYRMATRKKILVSRYWTDLERHAVAKAIAEEDWDAAGWDPDGYFAIPLLVEWWVRRILLDTAEELNVLMDMNDIFPAYYATFDPNRT